MPPMMPPMMGAQDMATQLAMWNWLSMQQQGMQWAAAQQGMPFYPPAAAPFAFPPVAPPMDADISALLATISAPVKEKQEEAASVPLQPKETARLFGEISNILESPRKSPSKSPTRFPSMSPR